MSNRSHPGEETVNPAAGDRAGWQVAQTGIALAAMVRLYRSRKMRPRWASVGLAVTLLAVGSLTIGCGRSDGVSIQGELDIVAHT
jgi:hypothetical protein